MIDKKDKVEITFAPGCFDDFEGTQEELDAFVKELTEMLENCSDEELMEMTVPLDDVWDEIDETERSKIIENFENRDKKRNTLN